MINLDSLIGRVAIVNRSDGKVEDIVAGVVRGYYLYHRLPCLIIEVPFEDTSKLIDRPIDNVKLS